MPLGKAIVLLGIIGIGIWALRAHQVEILEGIGWVETAEVHPLLRAQGHYHAFQYEQAVAAYREALREGLEEPQRREAYFRIAGALDKSHRKAEAIAAYQEAVTLYPRSNDAARAQSAMERLRLEMGQ